MSFDLLGNKDIVDSISRSIKSNTLFHGYLLSGPNGSGKKKLAREIAAAVECRNSDFPCRICAQCKKVLSDIHPDVISFSTPKDKKSIPLDIIREKVVADSYILPNEGFRKVYIIEDADKLTESAQNALLLTVEEPPSYALYILLCSNSDAILPTLRSRLIEYQMKPISYDEMEMYLIKKYNGISYDKIKNAYNISNGFLGQAISYLDNSNSTNSSMIDEFFKVINSDELRIFRFCNKLENIDKSEFLSFLSTCHDLLQQSISTDSQDLYNLSITQSIYLYELFNTLIDLFNKNVNTPHLAGYLSVKCLDLHMI